MKFRIKVFLGLSGLVLFWFLVFYPSILPKMLELNIYPLLAVIIFESLFFLTTYLLSLLILGKGSKHTLKLSIALFIAYHIIDAVEPPFILNSLGQWDLSSSSYLISWDYGISYFLKQTFNLTGSTLYYVTNIGFTALLSVILIFIIKPTILGKVMKKILD